MLAESTLAKAKRTLPMLFSLYHLVNFLHREAVASLPLCGKMRAQAKVRNWSDQGSCWLPATWGQLELEAASSLAQFGA